jgi:hypothetical protein
LGAAEFLDAKAAETGDLARLKDGNRGATPNLVMALDK